MNRSPVRTPPGSRRWVDVHYVADVTGFRPATIYRMAREGRIPADKVGRITRFNLADLDRWMASRPGASS